MLFEWVDGVSWDSFEDSDAYGLIKLNYPRPLWAVYDIDSQRIVAVSAPNSHLMAWCKRFLLNRCIYETRVSNFLSVSNAQIVNKLSLMIDSKLATAAQS